MLGTMGRLTPDDTAVTDDIEHPDVTAPAHPKGEWVSKSDLVAYRRCPYAFWLCDAGQIRPWEALGYSGPPTAGRESAFEDHLEIAKKGLPQLRRGFVFERDSLLFRNADRKLLGRPDGLRTEGGALFPVTLKIQGDVSRSDELALAFYWLLLEPFQRAQRPEPLGYVIIAWTCQLRKVRLLPERFDEVLCEAIREARARGVKPRICRCAYCDGRPEVVQAAIDGKDLSCIWGIHRHAVKLNGLGLRSWVELPAVDPHQIGISPRVMAGHLAHIKAYEERRPIIFGEERLQLRDFIVLDLEYGSHRFEDPYTGLESIIWLIGICLVRDGRRRYEFLWADSSSQEERIIVRLLKRLEESGDLPIVTWSGQSADLPRIRQRVSPATKALFERHFLRHVDAAAFLRKNVRLPIPRFGLKEVAEYFGVVRRSRVLNGREANQIYDEYRRPFVVARDGQIRKLLRDKKRRRLRLRLERYNRDDLKSVVEIVGKLREL